MTFRITKPGFYRTRDGRKAEVFAVLPERANTAYPAIGGNGFRWRTDGLCCSSMGEMPNDLVAEWVEPVVQTICVDSKGYIWASGGNTAITRRITFRDGKIVDVTDEVG